MNKGLMITISGETMDEVRESVKKVAASLGLDVSSPQIELPLSQPASSQGTGVEEPAKRGRKPKSLEPEVVINAPAAQLPSENPVSSNAAPASKQDAIDALTALNGKKGITAAREVLLKFKAQRFSELKDADYGEFVVAAKAAAA